MIDNKQIFLSAHALAKKARQGGDNYNVCFAAALKEIYALIAEFKSKKGHIVCNAKNGANYIQVPADIADSLIGVEQVASCRYIRGGAEYDNLPAWMRQGLGIYGYVYSQFMGDSKGSEFDHNGVRVVRIYGKSQEKSVQIVEA